MVKDGSVRFGRLRKSERCAWEMMRRVLSVPGLKVAIAALPALFVASCAPVFTPDLVNAIQSVQYQPVSADGDAVKLAVHESGRGTPLILIHGLGASSYTWRKIAPELAKRHRVIAIDLKGFGQSDKPLDERYSIFDQARLIGDYITRNNLKDATLVGHSFGGGVALAVALDQLDAGRTNIRKLVLIDSIAYRQPLPFFFRILRTPVIGEIGLSLVPPEVQMERALAVAYLEDGKVTEDAVRNYASALHSEGGRHALLRTIDSLDPVQADEISKRYKELYLPTLVLWCDRDKIVPLKIGRRLARELPNARLKVMRKCGHIPHEEQPEDTLKVIADFAIL
jgi:pimeloyl-ACP methyl ester carboxylesterase